MRFIKFSEYFDNKKKIKSKPDNLAADLDIAKTNKDPSKISTNNYEKTLSDKNNIPSSPPNHKNNLINNYFCENKEINKDKVLIDWNFYEGKNKQLLEKENIKNYSFVKEKLCEINKFKLPNKYISISGWTYPLTKKRLFKIEDWHKTIKILKSNNVKGVILNNQNWYLDNLWFKEIIKEDCFINLTGKTSYFEAIEIVKNSKGFIGIDSSLSIIATQSLLEKSIIIKSNKGSSSRKLCNYYYSNLKTKKCLSVNIKLNKLILQ